MTYLRKKAKNKNGVKSCSLGVMKYSSPQKNQVLKEKARACVRAYTREKIGNHNSTVCNTWDTTAGDHPKTSLSFIGAVQTTEESTTAGGCSLFSDKGFSKKAKDFLASGVYPLPKRCCLGSLKEWNEINRRLNG